MNERRSNWKEAVSKKSLERQKQREQLLLDLDEIRERIQKSPISEFDSLKLQQRTIIATLATLHEE